jgi:mono/diheme cytochrome c family protein
MLRGLAALGAVAVAVALGGCASPAPERPSAASPDPVLADLGESVYLRYCGACHGDGARGDGPAAGALRVPPSDLTRISARRGGGFPEGEIARFIDGRFAVQAHGTREMPIWGQRLGEQIPDAGVSEEVVRGQISVVVEYLKSIQRSD